MANRPPVQFVVFDAVGTLITPQPAAHEVYYRVGRRNGSGLSVAEVRRRLSAALQADARDGDSGGGRSSPQREEARWQALVCKVFAEVPRGETIFPALWEHFARPQSWRVFADVEPLWQVLHARGLRIGVASNFDQRLPRLCRRLVPLHEAEFVFHSAQLGARKPSAFFFQEIQRRLGLPSAALLMVGDDRRADYDGAIRAGWQAVWLDRRSNAAAAPPSIAQLSQLPSRLLAD